MPTPWSCVGCSTSSRATKRWPERGQRCRPATTVARRRRRPALLRRKAAEFLKAYRDGGAGDISIGPEDRLPISLRLAATRARRRGPGPLRGGAGRSTRGPAASSGDAAAPERLEAFTVIVIGGGLGGLNAALQLKRAGIPFTVIEKNAGVGGRGSRTGIPAAGSTRRAAPTLTSSASTSATPTRSARRGERELLQLGRRHLRPARRHPLQDRGEAR